MNKKRLKILKLFSKTFLVAPAAGLGAEPARTTS